MIFSTSLAEVNLLPVRPSAVLPILILLAKSSTVFLKQAQTFTNPTNPVLRFFLTSWQAPPFLFVNLNLRMLGSV